MVVRSRVSELWTIVISTRFSRVYTSVLSVCPKYYKLVRKDFLSIIENPRQEHLVENAGFIRDGLLTRTYIQIKKGLNYFYAKRKISADSMSTTH